MSIGVRESTSIGVRVSLEDGNRGVLGETDMYGLVSGALREEDGKARVPRSSCRSSKDDYHIERIGRLPGTMMWAPENLGEGS